MPGGSIGGLEGIFSIPEGPVDRASGIEPLDDEEEKRLVQEMLALVGQHPRYGYRRIWALLRTGGLDGESKADLSAVASGRAESAAKTAQKAAFGP